MVKRKPNFQGLSGQARDMHDFSKSNPPPPTEYLDRKIYHLTLREGCCARFDDRTGEARHSSRAGCLQILWLNKQTCL